MVQWFCSLSIKVFNGLHLAWDNGSVWHKDWCHVNCRSFWPMFHGPLFFSFYYPGQYLVVMHHVYVIGLLWLCKWLHTIFSAVWPLIHILLICWIYPTLSSVFASYFGYFWICLTLHPYDYVILRSNTCVLDQGTWPGHLCILNTFLVCCWKRRNNQNLRI